MSVVTKWSIPVATLAITLLTVYLPAQCEKLSTLKQDSVHRRQTVLHTSLGSIRWYQSDEMWLCRSVLYVHRGKGKSCASITHLVFQGTPVDSAPWKRAYPKQRALNSALLWHHLQSGDRRRVFAPGKMTTAGISRTSWCHFCFLCSVTHGFLVQVCKDKQDVRTSWREGFTATRIIKLLPNCRFKMMRQLPWWCWTQQSLVVVFITPEQQDL